VAKKVKYFDKETLSEAMQILQPVTPTLKETEFQAHWYNEGFGLSVRDAQEYYLNRLKRLLVDCKTKRDVNRVLRESPFPKWPVYKTACFTKRTPEEENIFFWKNGFGSVIRTEFYEMMGKFVEYLNKLA